jgi:hypothetical protein
MRIAVLIALALVGSLLSGCIIVEETISEDGPIVAAEGQSYDGICGDHASCQLGEYCAFSLGTCGAEGGICVAGSSDMECPPNEAPICGCDGLTYVNGCEAWRLGVSIAYEGPCTPDAPPPTEANDTSDSDTCGGLTCGASEFCDFIDGSCGDYGTQTGFCRVTHGPCTGSAQAVCGCDDQTYGTQCDAVTAGVGVRHLGAC